MYKILIRYNDKNNLWQSYRTATTTATSTSVSTSFTEFETDDIEALKAEIIKLDAIYGHEGIKVVEDVTLKYSVDMVPSGAVDNPPENI